MWHIVSDTSCDLFSLEDGKGMIDFATIPFTIRIGDQEYTDDENMPVDEMLTVNGLARKIHAGRAGSGFHDFERTVRQLQQRMYSKADAAGGKPGQADCRD